MQVKIRDEKESDIDNINNVIINAFKDIEISDKKEHLIVNKLRELNGLKVSLVAELNNNIVGHIAFSQINTNTSIKNWYALAPVAITSKFQNKGIGSKLINVGLERLKEINVNGCVLIGYPDYYKRFGFTNATPGLFVKDIPHEYLMAISLKEKSIPNGEIYFHEAFFI